MKKKFFHQQFLYEFNFNDSVLKSIEEYSVKVNWGECRKRSGFNKFEGGQYHYGRKYSLKNEPSLIEFHKSLEECIFEVKQDIKQFRDSISQLLVSQSWLNRSSKGNVHFNHSHPLSILSGILYLTEPAYTIFTFDSIYKNQYLFPNKDFKEKHCHSGKKGTLILFPSNLSHYVGPHLDDQPRITLSFNTWFKGSIGDKSKAAYIPEEF